MFVSSKAHTYVVSEEVPSRLTSIGADRLIGNSQETTGNTYDAIQTYDSMLPYISTAQITSANCVENRYWTERLLARHCLLTSRDVRLQIEKSKQTFSPETALAPFRAWARFWATSLSGDNEKIDGQIHKGGVSRRRVWQAYYNTLSLLLQQGTSYPYPIEGSPITAKSVPTYESKIPANPRLQQMTELKDTEAIYESLLLKEVKFPKASEASSEVESWAGQVIVNWKICCGSTWQDSDVGHGGKEALSRNVLQVRQLRSSHSRNVFKSKMERLIMTMIPT